MYRLPSSIKPWQLEHQGISSIFVEREKKALQFIPLARHKKRRGNYIEANTYATQPPFLN